MPELVPASEAEPEWKKQAPVLKVRTPAPKREGGGPSYIPRVVARRESPFVAADGAPPLPADTARKTPKAPATPPPGFKPGVPDPERVEGLAKAALGELTKVEEKAKEAVDALAPLTPEATEVTQEAAEEAAQATETAINAAIVAVQAATRVLNQKMMEMGKTEAAMKTKSSLEFLALPGTLKHCKKKMEELKTAAVVMRKRPADEKATKAQQETFDKFDEDKDGFLKSEELQAFAKAEYSFEPSGETVEKILKNLGGDDAGVPFDKLQRLRAMVAIEKAMASATEREGKKAEVQEKAGDVEKELSEGDAALEKAQTTAGILGSKTLLQLRPSVEEVEKEVAAAREHVEKAEGMAEKVVKAEEGEQDEVLKSFREELASKFKAKGATVKSAAEAALALVEKSKKRFKQALVAEAEALRLQVAVAVRGAMQAKKKTGEELFKQALAKQDELKLEKFTEFLKSLGDLCPGEVLPESLRKDTEDAAKVEALFVQAAGDKEGSLKQDRFLWMFTRLGYVVLKETPLSEEKAGEAKRQLQPAEVVEALDLTESKGDAGAKYIRVRACKDGAEGWALVCDAEAPATEEGATPSAPAPRMEPAGGIFTCVKETILTGALKISEGETVRRIVKGEVLEALDFQKKDDACGVMRVECKAVRDGKKGWVSVAGNTGLAFLQRLQ